VADPCHIWPVQPRPPRIFVADDILSGRVSLQVYPLRYIYLTPSLSSIFQRGGAGYKVRTGNNGPADQLLSAIELLEVQGWEVVTIDIQGHVACLRRAMRR
jgi:hypothetical protein